MTTREKVTRRRISFFVVLTKILPGRILSEADRQKTGLVIFNKFGRLKINVKQEERESDNNEKTYISFCWYL